jgi:signal transduction histidine kinase
MKTPKIQAVDAEYGNIELTPELRQRIFLSLLEDIGNEKEVLEQQTKVNLSLLEDINEAQEQLKRRYSELNMINNLVQELGGSLKMEMVLKTLVSAFKKMFTEDVNFAYIILPSDIEPITNLIYVQTAKILGVGYLEELKKSMVSAVVDAPNSYFDKAEVEKWAKQNFLYIFVEGERNEEDSKSRPKSSFDIPLVVGSDALGIVNISSEENDYLSERDMSLAKAVVGITASTISRLRQLTESEQSRIQSLVENLSNGVVMFDLDHKVTMSNRIAQETTGLPPKGFNLSELMEMLDGTETRIWDAVSETLKSGKIFTFDEITVERKIYEIIVMPLLDNDGNIDGGAIILHDVTHIKEIDRMKTEFVSVASHQLRTPLTAISLFVEMLANEEVGKLNKDQKDYVDNIYRSTKRMIRLVNDLLNVSRIETGRLKIDPQPTRLVEFIQAIIDESTPLLRTCKCNIIFKKPKNKLPMILIDQVLIHQVIHNLITNAIRYSTTENSSIIIRLEQNKDFYIISVSDNGIGIPKEDQERIFQKFFRADNAQKKETEGSGLGLYVAKMIVESSGGKIWFDSVLGKGTIFYVSLPVAGMKGKKGEVSIIE